MIMDKGTNEMKPQLLHSKSLLLSLLFLAKNFTHNYSQIFYLSNDTRFIPIEKELHCPRRFKLENSSGTLPISLACPLAQSVNSFYPSTVSPLNPWR